MSMPGCPCRTTVVPAESRSILGLRSPCISCADNERSSAVSTAITNAEESASPTVCKVSDRVVHTNGGIHWTNGLRRTRRGARSPVRPPTVCQNRARLLRAIRPAGDRQGHVDPNTARSSRLNDRFTQLVTSLLPVLSPACEPLRPDLDDDVETADVVRATCSEPNLDIARLELVVVWLLGAFDGQ